MCKKISNKRFEKIMDSLYQKEVWIQIIIPTTNIHKFFPNFEFDILTNGKYQFGTEDIDSDRMPFNIDIEDIESIHRDTFAPTCNGEHLFINMIDDTVFTVEYNV
jgi:hypothetical protein